MFHIQISTWKIFANLFLLLPPQLVYSSPRGNKFLVSPGDEGDGPFSTTYLVGDEKGFRLSGQSDLWIPFSPFWNSTWDPRQPGEAVISAIDMNENLIAVIVTIRGDRSLPLRSDLLVLTCSEILPLFGCTDVALHAAIPRIAHSKHPNLASDSVLNVPTGSTSVMVHVDRDSASAIFVDIHKPSGDYNATWSSYDVPVRSSSMGSSAFVGFRNEMAAYVGCETVNVFRRKPFGTSPITNVTLYSMEIVCSYKDLRYCDAFNSRIAASMSESVVAVSFREEGYFLAANLAVFDNTCKRRIEVLTPSGPNSGSDFVVSMLLSVPARSFATILTYRDVGLDFTKPIIPPNGTAFLWASTSSSVELMYPGTHAQFRVYPNRFWSPSIDTSEQPYLAVTRERIYFVRDPDAMEAAYGLSAGVKGKQLCRGAHQSSLFCEHADRDGVAKCPMGTYKYFGLDMSPCMPCPLDSYTNAVGSSSCINLTPEEEDVLVAPAWSVHPQKAEVVYRSDIVTRYDFPMREEQKSAQNVLLRALFLSPENTAGFPFFITVVVSTVLLVVLGIVCFFLWRSNRRNRLFRFIRGLDAFKIAHMRMKSQTFIVYKSAFGGLLTVFMGILALLASVYVIQMGLDYRPIYIGHSEDRIPQNSQREENLYSVGDYHGEMEQLLSNMRHSTSWRITITFHDCYWPSYPHDEPLSTIRDCYNAFNDDCEVALDWDVRNDTCFAILDIPTPHTFVGTPQFRLDFAMVEMRFTSFSTRLEAVDCGTGWVYPETTKECQLVGSSFQKVAYIDPKLGNVLAGDYVLTFQSTYVIRKTEEAGSKPRVQSYISLSTQQFSTAPSITVKSFLEFWGSSGPGPGPDNGGFAISVRLIENPMWIFQNEHRIIQFFDGVALLVVTLIVIFNIVRVIATIEKKLTEKFCPPKLHEYEVLVDKTQ